MVCFWSCPANGTSSFVLIGNVRMLWTACASLHWSMTSSLATCFMNFDLLHCAVEAMPQAAVAPQTPVTPYVVSDANYQVFSLDPGVLTPSASWSPNFATPQTPLQSFSTLHLLLWPSSSRPQKQKHVHDENHPTIQLPHLSLPKKQKSPSLPQQKIAIVLSAIRNDASWSFSEFLFHVFLDKDQDGQIIECKQSHGNTVQAFLSGRSKHSPGEILDIWWNHRDGCLDWEKSSFPHARMQNCKCINTI